MVSMGYFGRLNDLGQRVRRIAAADVVGHGVVEDEIVLQHGPNLGTQRVQGHPAQIVLVDANFARGRVEEPWNQINEGVFLQIFGADQTDSLAGRNGQRDFFQQHAIAARLAQADVIEFDLLGERRQELGADDLADVAAAVEKFEEMFGRLASTAQYLARVEPCLYRPVQADQRGGQRHEAGHAELLIEDEDTGHEEQQHGTQQGQTDEQRLVHRLATQPA